MKTNSSVNRILLRAGLRQACLGLVAVLLSLPLLWMLHRLVGVAAPSPGSVLLLGTSVIVSFVGGGLLGVAVYEFGPGIGLGRTRASGWIAALGGLLVGGLVGFGAASLYGQSILDSMAAQGMSMVWNQRDGLMNQTQDTAINGAKTLALQGAARLPVLVLLLWTLVGPTVGAALEYRLASRR